MKIQELIDEIQELTDEYLKLEITDGYMKETINCIICGNPVAIIMLLGDIRFNKDVEIEIKDSVVCRDCLQNKPIEEIMLNVDV